MATRTAHPMTVTVQVAGRQWTVTSERNPNAAPYIVRRGPSGLTCDCADSLYRRQDCKHVQLVADLLIAERAAARETEIAAEEAALAAKKASLEDARSRAMFLLTGNPKYDKTV